MLEKTKHAELLLEYGAQPDARNVHGKVPLQLLPGDAVRSTKLYFKKMFEVRWNIDDDSHTHEEDGWIDGKGGSEMSIWMVYKWIQTMT